MYSKSSFQTFDRLEFNFIIIPLHTDNENITFGEKLTSERSERVTLKTEFSTYFSLVKKFFEIFYNCANFDFAHYATSGIPGTTINNLFLKRSERSKQMTLTKTLLKPFKTVCIF